ncbi:XkdW family protein [Paenibacillus profundus]|uniref:XkdW family protein n=1 Tax=Paenibacillus profundus TaxID=1173085 RepID=A0ABS8Y9J0_9BACL|nr:XkdW family protein [Paenibacillus profundus]MCE5168538.1 XkdW family protein [Paenibacillus profundus]
MKYAYITDLNGRYIEPTLVADSVTGVFDRREPVQSNEEEPQELPQKDDEQPNEPETVHVGYMVAVPLPAGLYEPTFDVQGYRQAMTDYEAAYAEYIAAMAEYDPEGEEPQPQPPSPVDGPSFWRNGLTQDEIDALQPKPEPSQTDVLGQELTQMKLKGIQQQAVIDGLGKELTKAKLEIIAMKGEQTA